MKELEIDFSSEITAKKGKAPLNKPFRLPSGSKKKFGVYVKNDKESVRDIQETRCKSCN